MKPTLLLACTSTIALLVAAPALAQTDPAAPTAPAAVADATVQAGDTPDAAAQSDEIVVTASSGERSRFRSSISVSQISNEAIQNFTPRSEAEVLRNIPGLQPSDTAGPGGNANIGVRGIPVSTGGSEYVALQEDGLPTVLFGDMNFGNNDYWLRFDQNVQRVEAVRGGSASTFSSQAPGAVINYLSKTGDKAGGQIAYSNGVGFREHRLDFDYGAPIDDTLRFHVGGYARNGGGLTNERFNILRGYQIKANVTKDLADGRGFVRLYFKRLDEQAPTNTTTPSIATLDGNKVTDFKPLPTFDGRDGSSYSIYNRSFQYLDYDGRGIRNAEVEGIHPRVTGLGAQFHYEVNDWLTLDNVARYQWISGNFTTQFINVASRTGAGGVIGSTVNGQVVGSLRYAAGPSQGQVYTGAYVNNNPNINTLMKNMNNFANNLALNGKFDVGGGKTTVSTGVFVMKQNIEQDWHVNRNFAELNGENAAPLDLFSTTGTQLTAAGQAGFNDNWGSCCARRVDLSYTDVAPFLQVGYETGGLNLDASVRYDTVSGNGTAQGGVAGPTTRVSDALGSALIPSLVLSPTIEKIDYSDSYVSWSLGALYAFSGNTSVFGRVSRGGRFNADRRVLSGNFNADGSLNAQGQSTSVNFLNQQEIGLKQRGQVFGGSYSVEVTGFRSTLTENNYDFTRINNPAPNNDPNISNGYRSFGVEFSSRLNSGGFHLSVDATYSNSKIVSSVTPALVGNRPGGLPEFLYVVSPSYDAGIVAFGVSVNGQTATPSDDFNLYTIKGSTFVNGFVTVRPIERVELGLNVNNLFDKLGFRGGGSLNPILSSTSAVFNNTALYGRTVTASVRYRF
ncbi:TonB-dependent receptor [Sphingomonas sp. Leaf407]|uniref:TonB-dependent receptor domain-containing protein n=1 Tax=unclassified Sphingomonas TaxID=196159 RepID=UPI0006FCB2B7|nr:MULTISPECIES: TonB-dependent receptor [unclassified Sphingomonas]KQN40851.1 TonB-dependent receptor [Sphingomonas sp. Leaf42]KQT30205.1 TonB-dependent receptor [Sphingomonas sp. Leaf407]